MLYDARVNIHNAVNSSFFIVKCLESVVYLADCHLLNGWQHIIMI